MAATEQGRPTWDQMKLRADGHLKWGPRPFTAFISVTIGGRPVPAVICIGTDNAHARTPGAR